MWLSIHIYFATLVPPHTHTQYRLLNHVRASLQLGRSRQSVRRRRVLFHIKLWHHIHSCLVVLFVVGKYLSHIIVDLRFSTHVEDRNLFGFIEWIVSFFCDGVWMRKRLHRKYLIRYELHWLMIITLALVCFKKKMYEENATRECLRFREKISLFGSVSLKISLSLFENLSLWKSLSVSVSLFLSLLCFSQKKIVHDHNKERLW